MSDIEDDTSMETKLTISPSALAATRRLDDSFQDLRINTARDATQPSVEHKSPLLIDRKGNPLSAERTRMYQSPDRSPTRRPATPLKGIGRFLQHRRRGASPDSPSVRTDLLSGSVVAGLVATAIEEVETSGPDPQRNKPMADLVERAVKAEFKINQLEEQKAQIWNLVSIAEEQADEIREKLTNLVSVVFAMIIVDALVLIYASLMEISQLQQWVATILVLHFSMLVPFAYRLREICFPRPMDAEDEEDDEESDSKVSVATSDDAPNSASPARSQQKRPTPNEEDLSKEQSALAEMKETLALLPVDQTGIEWLKAASDDVLLAFLRGHHLNVSKAFKYFVKCAEWREEYRANELITSWGKSATKSAALLKQTFPVSHLGKTNDGQRVYLFRLAMCDLPGYFRTCAVEDVTRHVLCEFEKHRVAAKWRPGVLLIDLGVNASDENKPVFSVGQMRAWIAAMLQFLSTMTKICDPFYPEMFSDIYFARTPIPFWATWRVAQLLIPVRTREKITIFGVADVETKLKQVLPDKCIPTFLGGLVDVSGAPKGGMIVSSSAARAMQGAD